MSLAHGNRLIVTDGLVLCLDAANTRSYPGTGTTWFDLSGNENHFTLNGVDFVETPSKHFSFGDNEGDSIARSATDVIGGLIDLSVDMFMRFDVIQSQMALLSYATSTQDNEFLLFQNSQTFQIFANTTSPAGSVAFPTSNYNVGNFIQFSMTRSNNLYKIYINGEYITTEITSQMPPVDTGGAILFGQEQDLVLGGYNANQDFPGDISSVKIYNRALTANEIQQNFNAMKGRYGL